jgi:hypothetical protein
MKEKHTRPPEDYQVFEITDFLREIDRVLPTIEGAVHRAIVFKIRSLFGALLYSQIMGDLVPHFSVTNEVLLGAIETLRCCGISPAGWPPPPGPEALLRPRLTFVGGWGEPAATGGARS